MVALSEQATDWRYPRSGLALLPVTLRPVFRPVIRHPPLSDGSRTSPASELGPSIWSSRIPKDCEVIATALVERLNIAWFRIQSCKVKLAALHPPRLAGAGCLEQLPLSKLVIGQLQRHKLWDPEVLFKQSLAQLLALKGFGVRRLLELVAVLEAAGAMPEQAQAGIESVTVLGTASDFERLEQFEELLGATDIPSSDIRFGSLIQQLHTRAGSLRKAIRTLKAGVPNFRHPTQDPWVGIRETLTRIEELWKQLQGGTLEDDLLGVLRVIANRERKVRCLAQRLGWQDGRQRTLQAVGEQEGLTRERVRQYESKAQKALHGRSVFAPKLLQTLAQARALAPCAEGELAESLATQGLTRHRWRPSTLIAAAAFLGIPHGLTVTELGGGEYLASDPANATLGDLALSRAQAIARSEGAVCLRDLAFHLSEQLQRWVSQKEVRAIMSSLSEVRWLNESQGWLWFGEHPRHRVLNNLRKMLSVAPRLMIDEAYEGLVRSYRMDVEPVCPKPIVLALCHQVPWIRVRQMSHLTPRAPLDYREILVGVERTMTSTLLEAGGALDHYSFRRLCRKRGIPPTTFGVYEGNSPLFRRIQPNIWGLRGVYPTSKLLLQLSRKVARRQRLLAGRSPFRSLTQAVSDIPHNPHRFRRLFELTAASFRNYILCVSGLGARVGTKFTVRFNDKPIGEVEIRAKGRLKGLLTLLKAQGVQPGERYVAEFDTHALAISFRPAEVPGLADTRP